VFRPTAAAAAALLIAAAGATTASATVTPRASLDTPNQTALLASRGAVVTVDAPRNSVARLALFAGGKQISGARSIAVGRSTHVRSVLTLRGGGVALLRRCTPTQLEVRMTVRRGSHTVTVRSRHALVLDARRCPAPVMPDTPKQPVDTPPAGNPPADTPPVNTPEHSAPVFKVGTAVVDISPKTPMADGGYATNYTINGVRDPLQVRAFFIGHGKDAVTFVSVDSQGWFAAYQAPNAGDGAQDARDEAAAGLAARGYDVSAANVVVSATHDHAAPTIMGIWGHTDPAYLHSIKQAAVKAVLDAESHARDAELWSATGTIKGLVSQVQGTDQMAGFSVDTQMPILWARQPGTGATIATYINVPTHVDQFNPTSSDSTEHLFSADYPGWVRSRLNELLGGTSVVAQSTLGRQESIGADPGYAEVGKQGEFITNQVLRALTHARPIEDTTLAANEQSFSTPAENTGLLAAMSCNHVGGPLGCPGPLTEPAGNNGAGTWDWTPVGQIFTINRALSAPWFTMAAGPSFGLGTEATVARVGDQVYATAPGEAFPEVTSAIQRSFADSDGIRDAHIIDHAGDQLGYYWDQRDGIYPSAQLAQSDFQRFNVGSHLAQDNVDAVKAAGAALGLNPTAQSAFAQIDNPDAFSQPTIQFYSDRVETDATTVSFYGTAKKAQAAGAASTSFGSSAVTPADNNIAWDFGDGTTDVLAKGTRFDHTFPGPGMYRVRASVTDNLGDTYRWAQWVRIDPKLSVGIVRKPGAELTVNAIGGSADVLAAHWEFSDGSNAEGQTVTAPAGADHATVTIVDGAGDTATTTVAIG
jgi:hypothetical protein